MTLSQRLTVGTLVLASCLGGAHMILSRAQPGVARLGGSLAPLRPLAEPEIVGRIHPSQLGKGQIISLADNGSEVVLLQHNGWLSVGLSGVRGPFGASARDGEGRINSGVAIAVRDSIVYVLDRAPPSVLVFTAEGVFRRKLFLRPANSLFSFSPEHFAVQRDGRLIVSGFRGVGGSDAMRVILSEDSDGTFHTLASIPAGLFDLVLPVPARSGGVYIVESAYSISERAADGVPVRRFVRPRPPRVPLPDSVRRSLRRLSLQLVTMGSEQRHVPKYLPAVFAAIERSGGSLVVAMLTAIDSVLIEEIDPNGTPVWTLTEEPLPLPVGLTDHGVIRIREDVNVTTVERRRWLNRHDDH